MLQKYCSHVTKQISKSITRNLREEKSDPEFLQYIILKCSAFSKKKKRRNVNKQESMWEMGEWKRQKSLLDAQMSDLIDFTTSIIVCSKN